VGSTVLADVILTYSNSTTIGTSGSSPFSWAEGTNYATASTLGIVGAGTTCTPGAVTTGTTCYALSAVINGIPSVPTLAINTFNFNLQSVANAWKLASAQISDSGAGTQGGTPVACAFEFISDSQVIVPGATPGFVISVSSACTATITPAGTPTANAGCAAAATTGVTSVNLISGVITSYGSTGAVGTWTCGPTVTTGTPPITVLDVSYYISAVNGATLTGSTVYVTPYM
jgi:hypothetical protein